MNLCAAPGHKVRAISLATVPYPVNNDNASQYLEFGKVYTVLYSRLYASHAEVWLEEFPEIRFSSSLFDDVEEQYDVVTILHPDFQKYLAQMERGGIAELLKRVKG